MIVDKTVEFVGVTCDVDITTYQKGAPSIQLYCVATGEPVATATVDINKPLPENHVAVKDYSENTGMLKVLVEAEVVSEPTTYIANGFVRIPVCKLLLGV